TQVSPFFLDTGCHDPLLAPGTPALPKSLPQPPWAWTATQPTPPAITARQHHQPPPPAAPLAITTVTATLAPGLGYHTTSVPAPPVTSGLGRDPHHASQSCITADPTPAHHALLLLPLTTPSPGAATCRWNPGLSPGPYVLRSI
ncbi:hypothetical protein C0993_007152, partial [Termitomyces sp. T159_Od127]